MAPSMDLVPGDDAAEMSAHGVDSWRCAAGGLGAAVIRLRRSEGNRQRVVGELQGSKCKGEMKWVWGETRRK